MNARFYVPYLNRFISADSIIPQPTDPQSYNRYSYARNNPIRYSDPSGHCAVDEEFRKQCADAEPRALVNFTAVVGEVWTLEEIVPVTAGAMLVANALYEESGGKYGSPAETYLKVYGGTVTWHKTGTTCMSATGYDCYAATQSNRLINVHTDIYERDRAGELKKDANGNYISQIPDADTSDQWAVHELGHAFEFRVNVELGTYHVRNQLPTDIRHRDGFAGPAYGYQQSEKNGNGEIYADMFIGWTYGQWGTGEYLADAEAKSNFMTTNMAAWIDVAAR